MAKPTPLMDFSADFRSDDPKIKQRYEIFQNRKHRIAVARFCLKNLMYDIYTAYMCITYMQLNLLNKCEEDFSDAYLAFVKVFLIESDKSKGINGAPYELNIGQTEAQTLIDYEKNYPQKKLPIRELDHALNTIKDELITNLSENLFPHQDFKNSYYNTRRYANNKLGQELKKYKLRNTDTDNQKFHRKVREKLACGRFPIDYIFPKEVL